jgi:cobalt-zinc-cadmium efflux system membrane fusion protein
VLVIEGQPIKKGEVLAYLENPEFISIQQEFLSAREELTLYEKEYERKKALIADNIASAKSYQQAETNYRRAKNKLDALSAQLRLLNISSSYLDKNGVASAVPIVSPIAGFVRLVEINVGKYVEPRDEMFEIVDNEHIHIDLMVYEKDIHKVKEEQQVVFSLSSIPDQTFNARVFAVGKAFESNPRALKVHAEITDKDVGLLPGMYVDARIVTDTRNVTAVPNDAIVSESGLDYIFVQVTSETKHNDDHHDEEESHAHEQEAHDHHASPEKLIFQKIEVSTGVSDMGFTEVVPAQKIPKDATNGLNDPIIVTKGAYYLLAEMGKNERGHQH